MADSKLSALTELTAPASVDIFAIVDDPAGTPITKKVTLANLLGNVPSGQSLGWSDASIARVGANVVGVEKLQVANYINANSAFGALQISNGNSFVWTAFSCYVASGYFSIGGTNTRLYSDASNALAQRNGVNPQAFNIYNTYTDASNYERGCIKWSSNTFIIGSESAGTGSARITRLVGSSVEIYSGSSPTQSMAITTAYVGFTRTLYALAANLDLGWQTTPFRDIYLKPSSSLTPTNNGTLCIEATSNTTLTFKYKGSDGTVRSGTVTLS